MRPSRIQAVLAIPTLFLLLALPAAAMAPAGPEERTAQSSAKETGACPPGSNPANAPAAAAGKDAAPRLVQTGDATPPPPQKDEAPLTEREKEMMALIKSLQERVAKLEAAQAAAGTPLASSAGAAAPEAAPQAPTRQPAPLMEQKGVTLEVEVRKGDVSVEPTAGPERKKFGSYTPNFGFKVADTEYGDMNISIISYVRYLNQLGLDETYTDAFGNTKNVQQRQDIQLNKVQIKFLGWILSRQFRYYLYAWTSNASMGQSAQVILGGNLNYTFNKYITLAGGLNALPGTRSVEGNFPFWLSEDSRLIADEFFRPSYTMGFWAKGQITDHLRYHAMLGDNLSILGVNSAQLNYRLNTFAGALVWTPCADDYGVAFGDFENHENLVVRLGAHFSRSDEDRQSQPNTESIENTQLRLSDGSIIFTPGLFGEGINITDATYKMTAFDGGLKYRGFSLDGEYFLRWIGNFRGPNTEGLPGLFDHGCQLQTSMMVIPKSLQLYAGASTIFGQYGDPWDVRTGVNWFPWKNKIFRWNTEALYLHKSPVGYSSVPFALGGTGLVFHSNCELNF